MTPRSSPPTWDAVLLDLDGTLVDAGAEITGGLRDALATVGAPPLDAQQLRSFVGPPLEDSLGALPGFDDDLVTRTILAYRRHYDMLASPVFDGVHDALTALRGAGLRLALATSKPQHLAESIVAHHGFSLDVVRGSLRERGRITKGDVVRAALDGLGAPARPVMVGDRSYDVRGSAEHGVPCVGVSWGYADPGELNEAHAVVHSPTALVDYLLGRDAQSPQTVLRA